MDYHGQRLVVIDIDGTRQAARQRALASSTDLPAPQRRMVEVCAPGYTGRQRGEVVRTRITVLQAHTQEWLGTFANPGNGEYAEELVSACQAITAYVTAKGISPADTLLRLDGLYGTTALLLKLQPFQLGFLTRGRDYQLLDHPTVQARLQQPYDLICIHPETQVQREIFDVGLVANWLADRPDMRIAYRVLVTRRAAPAERSQITVGKLRDDSVYELFLTSYPASRLPAATILELYQHRGSFEQVLSDEDAEQDPDRWCLHTPCGQAFWQILSQWVWNTRLTLGSIAAPQPLRWTRWESAPPALPDTTPANDVPATGVEEPQPEPPSPVVADAAVTPSSPELVPTYGPLRLAHSWAKARHALSAQAFTVGEDDTLICPAGKVLRPRERRPQPNGDLRVLYGAKAHDCRTCAQAESCLGPDAATSAPVGSAGLARLSAGSCR